MMKKKCPNCESERLETFYQISSVPVHSVLLMASREEAINFPKRDIELAFCSNCGFIHNSVFDPDIQTYSAKCEETQGFSNTFSSFHKHLAHYLIDKYQLHNKRILEIGCGKGEFITMICELGNNTGHGFDPAFVPDRNPDQHKRVEFKTDFYSEKHSHYRADFVCCKMTLEHIPNTLEFLQTVRKAIGNHLQTIVFFQVPEATRVMKDLGFWDVYYEHCSYFSPASIEFLFRKAGFMILDVDTTYDDQYLTIEAKPEEARAEKEVEVDISAIKSAFHYYRQNINELLDRWKSYLQHQWQDGKKIVLWGGGSKAVAFLTTLGIADEIQYAVDINPYKHGFYIPGLGQKVIAPRELLDYSPDIILLMNPIYTEEVQKELDSMGLAAQIIPVDFLSHDQTVSHV